MLRILAFSAFVFLAGFCCAQNDPLFLKVKTDVTIQVKEHSMGADLVNITMRDPNYPVDLLKKESEAICAELGSTARGLFVGKAPLAGADASLAFVEAKFATDGIIRKDGTLRIQPILRAFAGAPAPYTISGLTLEFSGVTPTAETVARYGDSGVVEAEARYTPTGPLQGIEYRIALESQEPEKIHFPDRYEPAQAPSAGKPVPSAKKSILPMLLGLIAIGLAVGILVYFAMLRTGSKNRL